MSGQPTGAGAMPDDAVDNAAGPAVGVAHSHAPAGDGDGPVAGEEEAMTLADLPRELLMQVVLHATGNGADIDTCASLASTCRTLWRFMPAIRVSLDLAAIRDTHNKGLPSAGACRQVACSMWPRPPPPPPTRARACSAHVQPDRAHTHARSLA